MSENTALRVDFVLEASHCGPLWRQPLLSPYHLWTWAPLLCLNLAPPPPPRCCCCRHFCRRRGAVSDLDASLHLFVPCLGFSSPQFSKGFVIWKVISRIVSCRFFRSFSKRGLLSPCSEVLLCPRCIGGASVCCRRQMRRISGGFTSNQSS